MVLQDEVLPLLIAVVLDEEEVDFIEVFVDRMGDYGGGFFELMVNFKQIDL